MSGKKDNADKAGLISENDVAALLGVTVGILKSAQRILPGGMPNRRGPGRRYYDRDEILSLLARRMAPCPLGPVPPKDMSNPDMLLTTQEAAKHLGVKPSRLQSDRQRSYEYGKPPVVPFYRLPDGRIRYRLGDLVIYTTQMDDKKAIL